MALRVLLTGHEGYLGRVMSPLIRAAGHEVVGLDTGFFRGSRFGAAPVPDSERIDVREIAPDLLREVDAVIHLAALSNDPLGDLNPSLTRAINEEATVRLARMAREAGVPRFIFASSCSLYGVAGEAVVAEDAGFAPITAYGRSKVAVEGKLARMADEEFSPVFLRNATVYGVSAALRLDIVVNNLVALGFATGEIVLESDGTPWRPLVHVEDVAHAFLAVLEAPRGAVHGRAFNVGRTGHDFRISELAEMVAEALPGTRIRLGDGARPDPRSYRVDCSRLAEALPAWRPRWTVAAGIRQLVAAFEAEGLSTGDLAGGRYVRIREIRRLMEADRLDRDLRWKSRPSTSGHASEHVKEVAT